MYCLTRRIDRNLPAQVEEVPIPICQTETGANILFLARQLASAWENAEHEAVVYHATKLGVYLEIKGEEGFDLATKSLELQTGRDKSKWIRLLNVRTAEHTQLDDATNEEIKRQKHLLPYSFRTARRNIFSREYQSMQMNFPAMEIISIKH